MPIDYIWLKLGDDKGLPFTDLSQTSINIHLTESILTPKVGYRLLDGEHFKIDALGGIRYWYVGTEPNAWNPRALATHDRPTGSMVWAAPGS